MPESTKELTLEQRINDLLIANGWDCEDRKRVTFMLRNRKPAHRTEQECSDAIYRRYGTNLSAFFADAHAEAKANAERRGAGGV
jgi:hypothetical protein